MPIVARRQEQKLLRSLYESKRAEFLIVYGRRRVGKTFLISEYFGKNMFFFHTGVDPGRKIPQLAAFTMSLENHGFPYREATDWLHAFSVLRKQVERDNSIRKVLFLDEISWIDSDNNGFLTALGYFWNSFAARRPDILLIVCGSATSWVLKHLIQNTGSLFDRHTRIMKVEPFTLCETEEYLKSRSVVYSRLTILELYMVVGGIPYYLDLIDGAYGLPKNVDRMFFGNNPALELEYDSLYSTLFRKYDAHHAVVAALAAKASGMTREEIIEKAKISNGGTLTKTLKELEQCGMLRRYIRYGCKERYARYQLMDVFTLFYHRHVKDNRMDKDFWSNHYNTPEINSWRGYAFEMVCLSHLDQIRKALGIAGVSADVSSYTAPGVQIDLVVDRKDGIINLCETKYSQDEYVITKKVKESLEKKESIFRKETQTTKALHTTLVSPFGVKTNIHSHVVHSQVTLDDLYSE